MIDTGDRTLFKLDQRLKEDTFFITDLTLCKVLLMNDARFPWLILVRMRERITEIYQLTDSDQILLCRESARVSQMMVQQFGGDSVNVAALGNIVTQLHVHHVIRSQDDVAWPSPVWGFGSTEPYTNKQQQELLKALATDLSAFAADYN